MTVGASMQPSRRGFLRGAAMLLAAPAIVRVASLMPVHAPAPRGITRTTMIQKFIDHCAANGGVAPQIAFLSPADYRTILHDFDPAFMPAGANGLRIAGVTVVPATDCPRGELRVILP